MKLGLGWTVVGLALAASVAGADQLAWNSRDIAERGARAIAPGSLLVAYCPLADHEAVEVWRVREVDVAAVDDGRYFEVRVSGERVFHSARTFDAGEYAETVEYQPVSSGESATLIREGIDLAYVYVPTGGATFRCLGRELELECDTPVETLTLPDEVLHAAGREPCSSPPRVQADGGPADPPAEKADPPADGVAEELKRSSSRPMLSPR